MDAIGSGNPELRVVSWNIQFGIEIEVAIEVLSTHPELRNADVICLQEMDPEGTAQVAQALEYGHFYSQASVHSRTQRPFGNAVLASSALVRTGVIELPHKAPVQGQPRIAVFAETHLHTTPVTVCSVHTEIPLLTGKKRLAQFEEIAAATRAWPETAIVAGDFNTVTPGAYKKLLQRMRDRGFASASHGSGPTLRRTGVRYTLDHVFTRGFHKHDAGVAVEAPGSDHDPIWVTLSRSTARPDPPDA